MRALALALLLALLSCAARAGEEACAGSPCSPGAFAPRDAEPTRGAAREGSGEAGRDERAPGWGDGAAGDEKPPGGGFRARASFALELLFEVLAATVFFAGVARLAAPTTTAFATSTWGDRWDRFFGFGGDAEGGCRAGGETKKRR